MSLSSSLPENDSNATLDIQGAMEDLKLLLFITVKLVW